jgi:hypothetical protein
MKILSLLFICLLSTSVYSKAKIESKPSSTDFNSAKLKGVKAIILSDYSKENLTKKQLEELKKKTISFGPAAVPALIEIMKSSKFPDKNKWVATFLLGKIVGKKSAPFISRFIQHPNWIMRMASLKTLNALKASSYDGLYAFALKDKSMIVRGQALENIRAMNLNKMAPAVWAMLYDKQNYHVPKKKKGKIKRTNLIKKVILTIGDLKFKKAEASLLTMIQKKKYKDIFSEMDYALSKITGKSSPKGRDHIKKEYWTKFRIKNMTI